ncbi:PQQ-binding-like beta-propeller repeat protein [uncultured Planktosalinus sp.]|uniref:outer membrane protein assembly factor BamB family protein n=1 Tax=uncultured Planktosalinus sp. TaxID=1810935 RepID=UPI0030D8F976
MKKIAYLSVLFIFILNLHHVSSQKSAVDYTYDLGGKINEMSLTQAGILVVATNDGLAGIKPKGTALHFKFTDYGRVKPEEYYFVPNSPYIVVSQGGFANFSSKKAVIDYISGQTLFSSEKDNWKQVYTETIAMPQNKLIISGLQKGGGMAENNTPKIAVYDLGTGKLDFSFYMFEPGKVTSGNFSVTGDSFLLDDKILIPTSRGIIAKSLTGNTLWETKIKNVNWMTVDETGKEIYAFESNLSGTNTEVYKLDVNGNEIWNKPAKVKGQVVNFEITPKGLAIVSNKEGGKGMLGAKSESEIGFLSAQTGEDLWEKAPKTKGYVQHFYIMDDGILFGIHQGGINKISYNGTPLFKKPLKTGENIHVMAKTPQGLIYITEEDANIVNLSTGETVWNKPLKFKRTNGVESTYDTNDKKYLVATDSELISVDENNGDFKTLASLKFQEKEGPTSMEMRNSGVFIGSSQNMFLVNNSGEEIYNSYFKSPGISTFGKIALGVVAVASTAMAVQQAAVAGANKNTLGQYNDYGAQANRNAEMFSSIGTASFKEMAKRFRASTETRDSQFILTKTDDGIGLVKVNKDTGNVEKEVVLNDKKPVYEVDEIEGILYYQNKDIIEAFLLD